MREQTRLGRASTLREPQSRRSATGTPPSVGSEYVRSNADDRNAMRESMALERSRTLKELLDESERLPVPLFREGHVWKRGHVHKAFQRRFFVLRGGMVNYYRDKSYYLRSEAPQGSVDCRDITILEGGEHEHGFEFTIVQPEGKELVCALPTPEERAAWIRDITKVAAEPLVIDSTRQRLSQKIRKHNPHLTQVVEEPTLLKKIFGIGPPTADMPASRLIFPLSPFAVCWTGLTCIFLAYTALVTPAVIAFHWLDDGLNPAPFPSRTYPALPLLPLARRRFPVTNIPHIPHPTPYALHRTPRTLHRIFDTTYTLPPDPVFAVCRVRARAHARVRRAARYLLPV